MAQGQYEKHLHSLSPEACKLNQIEYRQCFSFFCCMSHSSTLEPRSLVSHDDPLWHSARIFWEFSLETSWHGGWLTPQNISTSWTPLPERRIRFHCPSEYSFLLQVEGLFGVSYTPFFGKFDVICRHFLGIFLLAYHCVHLVSSAPSASPASSFSSATSNPTHT